MWQILNSFAKIEFFIAKSSFIVKMFAKKNLAKKWKIIHFWKALDHAISNIRKNLIKRNLKMGKFPLTGCLQKICNFLRKTCAIRYLMSAFQKAKFYENLTSESGSKQRFSLLQAKAVIQAVCLRTQAVSIKARF